MSATGHQPQCASRRAATLPCDCSAPPMSANDVADGVYYAIEYLERAFLSARLAQSSEAPAIAKAIKALRTIRIQDNT